MFLSKLDDDDGKIIEVERYNSDHRYIRMTLSQSYPHKIRGFFISLPAFTAFRKTTFEKIKEKNKDK